MTLDMARIEMLETELMRQAGLVIAARSVTSGTTLLADILAPLALNQDEDFDKWSERFYARTESFTCDEVQFALARLTLQGKIT